MKIQKLTDTNDNLSAYLFWCPGCEEHHSFDIRRWDFDQNLEKPTFSPSLLITMPNDPNYRCHLFVRAGKIEYCSDSKHRLAGQSVEMVDIETIPYK